MTLRPFKQDSPMDRADFWLQNILEATNGRWYIDLSAAERREACKLILELERAALRRVRAARSGKGE